MLGNWRTKVNEPATIGIRGSKSKPCAGRIDPSAANGRSKRKGKPSPANTHVGPGRKNKPRHHARKASQNREVK